MENSSLIKDILDEEMYKMYLEQSPSMVSGIKKLLTAGAKPKSIKAWCERVVGKSITSNCVGHMIDYVNKQVKN